MGSRPSESTAIQRHRFLLKKEDGRWWIDHEVPLATDQMIAPTLTAAMQQFVLQRAAEIRVRGQAVGVEQALRLGRMSGKVGLRDFMKEGDRMAAQYSSSRV